MRNWYWVMMQLRFLTAKGSGLSHIIMRMREAFGVYFRLWANISVIFHCWVWPRICWLIKKPLWISTVPKHHWKLITVRSVLSSRIIMDVFNTMRHVLNRTFREVRNSERSLKDGNNSYHHRNALSSTDTPFTSCTQIRQWHVDLTVARRYDSCS